MFDATTAIIGYLLLVAGIVFGIYWQLRFLAIVYNYSIGWFLGCLIVPLADVAFVILYFKIAWKAFALSLMFVLAAGLGAMMAGITFAH